MSRLRAILLRAGTAAMAWTLVATSCPAATLIETFDSNPLDSHWSVHGDAAHFQWDAASSRLDVTWDSGRPNAFLFRPLGTTLSRADDFRFSFTLRLEEVDPSGDGSFQLAIGLIRRADFEGPGYFRGSGVNPTYGVRNVVEFDYFPESPSIGATLSAVAVNTNNLRWAMVNLFPHALETGETYHIEVAHHAADRALALSAHLRGQVVASGSTRIGSSFGDFRVDAFSITSYSGDHQPAGYGGGLRARGSVDDVRLEFPDPPAEALRVVRDATGLEVTLAKAEGWEPRLQHTPALHADPWMPLAVPPVDAGDHWRFPLAKPGDGPGFLRVIWEKP